MFFYINLKPIPTTIASPNVEGILPLVGLALIVSIIGVVLTIINNKST